MSRETNFQVQARQVVGTLEDQHKYDLPTLRRFGVSAEPTNNFISPAVTGAQQLASALAEAKPEVMKTLNGVYKDYQDSEDELGTKDAFTTGNATYDQAIEVVAGKSSAYRAGYMRTQGFLQGETLRNKLLEDWQNTDKSATDPNTGVPTFDPKAWTADWWKQNTAGMQDTHFISGLNKEMGKAFQMVNAEWGKQNIEQAAAQQERMAVDLYKGDILSGATGMGIFETRRADAMSTIGGSRNDHIGHYTKAITEIAENARTPEEVQAVRKAVGVLSEKTSDGVPAFAKVAGDGQKIIQKAEDHFLHNLEVEEKAADRVREKAREDLSFDVAQKLAAGDVEGARKVFSEMTQGDRAKSYFDAKSLMDYTNAFERAAKREETESQQTYAASMVANGKLSPKEAFEALKENKIGKSGFQWIVGLYRQNLSDARADARAAAGQDFAFKKNPAFNRAMHIFDSLPGGDPMDIDGSKSRAYKYQKELAKAELVEAAIKGEIKNGDYAGWAEGRKRQIDGLVDKIKDGLDPSLFINVNGSKYNSQADFDAAVTSGKEKNPEVIRAFSTYFAFKNRKKTK